MKVKRKLVLLLGISCALNMTACSYKQLEDSIKHKMTGEESSGEDPNQAKVVENTTDTEEKNVFDKEERIVWKDYYEQEIHYTLEKVETAFNIGDLGISRDDFQDNSRSAILEDGTVADGEAGKQILVSADVKVKNVNFMSYDNGKRADTLNKVYVNNMAGSKTDMLDENVGGKAAAYLSAHGTGEKDYYMIELKAGEEAKVRLVWIVSETAFQKELFCYAIGEDNGMMEEQFFQLNQQEE